MMKNCCMAGLFSHSDRHSSGFKMTCLSCGLQWRSCALGNGWEVVPSNVIKITKMGNPGQFEGTYKTEGHEAFRFGARFDLFLIRNAWTKGCNLEDLADGFGPGFGTHGDWSAIRDSSEEAKLKMLERAINHLGLEM